jgi:hypothetical protein
MKLVLKFNSSDIYKFTKYLLLNIIRIVAKYPKNEGSLGINLFSLTEIITTSTHASKLN